MRLRTAARSVRRAARTARLGDFGNRVTVQCREECSLGQHLAVYQLDRWSIVCAGRETGETATNSKRRRVGGFGGEKDGGGRA